MWQVYNKNSQDLEMVKAVLCAGLFPNVGICKTRGKHLAYYTKEEGRVEPEPTSLVSRVDFLPLPWLMYTESVRGTCYVRYLTNVSDYMLLMFGGVLLCTKNGQSAEMLGGFLQFSASRRATTIVLVCYLIHLLSAFLSQSCCFFFFNVAPPSRLEYFSHILGHFSIRFMRLGCAGMEIGVAQATGAVTRSEVKGSYGF